MALVPALQVLTWPFLALTVFVLGRGWYLELSNGERWSSTWKKRSSVILVLSTLLAGTIWGLRFAGFLGGTPL
ncbi:MAG: hypothetical protein O2860_06200 [Chloroflexi bacterium]|nr:hypothetical protein [Chloroflexota bacterium]